MLRTWIYILKATRQSLGLRSREWALCNISSPFVLIISVSICHCHIGHYLPFFRLPPLFHFVIFPCLLLFSVLLSIYTLYPPNTCLFQCCFLLLWQTCQCQPSFFILFSLFPQFAFPLISLFSVLTLWSSLSRCTIWAFSLSFLSHLSISVICSGSQTSTLTIHLCQPYSSRHLLSPGTYPFTIQYMWVTCNWKHRVELLIHPYENHFQFSFHISATSSQSSSRFLSASLNTNMAHNFSRISHPSHNFLLTFCFWRELEELKTSHGSLFQLASPASCWEAAAADLSFLQPDQEKWGTGQIWLSKRMGAAKRWGEGCTMRLLRR